MKPQTKYRLKAGEKPFTASFSGRTYNFGETFRSYPDFIIGMYGERLEAEPKPKPAAPPPKPKPETEPPKGGK